MSERSLFTFIIVFTAGISNIAQADTFTYQDNFETNKATYESWRHSPVKPPSPFQLYGVLNYEDGLSGRGLGFYGGWEVVDGLHML